MLPLYSAVLSSDGLFADLIDLRGLYGAGRLRLTVDRGSARLSAGAAPDALDVIGDYSVGVSEVSIPLTRWVKVERLTGNSSTILVEILPHTADKRNVTAILSDGVLEISDPKGGSLVPAPLPRFPSGNAGWASGPAEWNIGSRTTPFVGWGALYLRDADFVFDTISLPGLRRNAGLADDLKWSAIVIEVADASAEGATVLDVANSATAVIASATIAVDPALDTLPAISGGLKDPRGKPIVLGPHNLPARFMVRYRAYNSVGGNAVVGEAETLGIVPPNAVGRGAFSMPGVYTTEYTCYYYNAVMNRWENSATRAGIAFQFSLAAEFSGPVVRMPEGHRFLRGWNASLAKILDGQAVAAKIAILGDSWVQGGFRFAQPIYRQLRGKFGDAGAGFVGFALAYAGGQPVGGADGAVASVTRAGAWVDDWSVSAKGLDYQSCKSTTVGDTVTLTLSATGFARRAVLHFYRQTNGGTVRWKVGAGAWTSISTAGVAGMVCQPIDFGSEITATTITLEVEVAGTDGVVLHGIDLRRDVAGVRIHKMGHSGGQASGFVGVAEQITLAELSSLSPDLLMFVFTTNEQYSGVSPTAMAANIETIIRRAKKALPYVDILIVSPFDNMTESHAYNWREYEKALQDLARKHSAAFFPTQSVVGAWGDGNKRGLIQDAIPHPTSAGGWLISGTLLREMLTLGI